jgi:hypothetical protein
MRKIQSKKALKFMERYIIIWVCIAIIAISVIFISGLKRANITCVDGTKATQKALCPQCTIDSHCGPDKSCDNETTTCHAKRCNVDEDCDTPSSACIFEKCTKSTGKI